MSTNVVQIDIAPLLSKLTRLSTDGATMADAVLSTVANQIVLDAKKNAPADLGKIRQSIGKEKIKGKDKYAYSVFSNAPESPFQEFGTGGRVDVPSDMKDVAMAFKGKRGGDFKAFILSLTGWVKRHGINPKGNFVVATRTKITGKNKGDIDEETAYGIARGILAKGLKPQPFLYPAFIAGRAKLPAMLQAAFDKLTTQQNGQSR